MHINGNNVVVNASNLYVPTDTEIANYKTLFDSVWMAHGGIISAEPFSLEKITGDKKAKVSFFVRLYDVEVIGNMPITITNAEDTQTNHKIVNGGYLPGISVGNIDSGEYAKYYVDMKNVTASQATHGINVVNAVNSTLENVYVHNCYQNGLNLRASILTVKNLKIGACGATGIELTPENSAEAGLNNDQKQTITFEGTFEAEGNIHSTNTSYMNAYKIELMPGYYATVPQLIEASIYLNGLTETSKMSNVLRINAQSEKELCLATFILVGSIANSSEAVYAAYQQGGIIDATKLTGVDKEHQFISMTVYAGEGIPLGKALLYNLNYGK